MNPIKQIILFFSLLIYSNSYTQFAEKDVIEIVTYGTKEELIYEWNYAIESSEFRYADLISDALLKRDPKNANFIYRKGYTLIHFKKNYAEALKLFSKILKNVVKDYKNELATESRCPYETYYYYAYCQDQLGNINDATTYYKKYLDENIGVTNIYTKLAQVKIVNIEVAEKYKANPKKNIILNSVGDSINTPDPEYAPIISPDGSSIFFTSRRIWKEDTYKEYLEDFTNFSTEDIYVSYKKGPGQWTTPKRLPFCRLDRNEATVAVSSDERTMYIYADNAKDGGNLYEVDLSKDRLDTLDLIKTEGVNTKDWDSHIFYSEDNTIAIFASDRAGGYGGRDLYRMIKLPDGTWSLPKNMGPVINSPYDEDAPFLSIDKKQLYFSSNSDKSMGGFDIFVSLKVSDNDWSSPVNLGYPINSTKDDIYFTTTADGLLGYLSSNRNGVKGETDIFEVEFISKEIKTSFILNGKLSRSNGITIKDNIYLQLQCLNCDTDRKKFIKPRTRDGKFISGLEPCRDYQLEVVNETGTVIHSEKFETSCTLTTESIIKDIFLK
jgi:tetratricopeptide (TPR) repeat protein